jgi:glucose/arabinose dehydrogenase
MMIGGPFGGEPVGFNFLPDGRVILLERNSGNIRLATVGASTSSIIHTVPNVTFELERGLLGVVPDPDWPTRPYLYIYFTESTGLSVLQMLTASGDLTDPQSSSLALGSPYRILEVPDEQAFHNGGTVEFLPDGTLLLSIGEDLTTCNSQDLTELRGKLLRLDVSGMPGGGTGPPPLADLAPADNPFAADPNGAAKLVYAWGLRNPFRYDVDEQTGDIYVGDVGYITEEEIDIIPAPSGGGQNFGWPIREGFGDPGLGATCGENNTFTDPVYTYFHNGMVAAIIGGPLYHPVDGSDDSLPASYDGSYFFFDWGGMWLRRIVDGPGGWDVAPPVPGQPSAENWGEDLGAVSQIRTGPDGALWLIVKNSSKAVSRGLYRIRRNAPTGVPGTVAVDGLTVTASPNPVRTGAAVELRWASPRTGPVSLRVYDVSGRLVRELSAPGHARTGTLEWRGDDANGRATPAGVYFYRFTQGEARATGQLTVLR